MSEFSKFQEALAKQAQFMFDNSTVLFNTETTKEEIWDTYLGAFPEGTNPVYVTNTEHDCNCCKSFIRACGSMVAIIDGEMVSIWDLNCEVGYYQEVADALAAYVKRKKIISMFMHDEPSVGRDHTTQMTEDGDIMWDHFYLRLPEYAYNTQGRSASIAGKLNTNHKVLARSMEEITKESVEIVLDLIAQNSLYRGEEHLNTVRLIRDLKKEHEQAHNKIYWSWLRANGLGTACSLRNTVIGTLLSDLSNDVPLEDAVKKFESKVAPANYKRPKALVTPKMIEAAQKEVAELGIEDSLYRRHAQLEDITINNVLFADRTAKKAMNVFDELTNDVKVDTKKYSKVEEISVKDFIEKVLPRTDSMEVLLENKHQGNLMTLIAPEHKDSKGIFKWNNNFSWTYNGEVADSMRERVVAAGGRVDGVLRFTHSWNHDGQNQSLMDLHVFHPNHNGQGEGGTKEVHDRYGNSNRVGWNNRKHLKTGGVQDVDFTAEPVNEVPIENITYPSTDNMPEGEYIFKIHNWASRRNPKSGFKAEIEANGKLYQFNYPHPVGNKEWITVATATLKNGVFTVNPILSSEEESKEIWGVNTQKFQKVDVVMSSPNHWDGEETGNKHWFFILEGCKNPDDVRGFYNEFLDESLKDHRKVFEVLASKLKVGYNEDQMSGVGFSSTQRNDLTCKVISGTLSRVVKIKF